MINMTKRLSFENTRMKYYFVHDDIIDVNFTFRNDINGQNPISSFAFNIENGENVFIRTCDNCE